MREAFLHAAADLVHADDRVALVLADISAGADPVPALAARHPDRVVNVGIREQLMVGVAGGLALAGVRPIVHSYAPFAVERPYEQLKVDLGHQGSGAVLVSIGASYDVGSGGRTHEAPEDVALIDTLPGWTVHVPGHPDEADRLVRDAVAADGLVYLRLSDATNAAPHHGAGLVTVRRGTEGVVVAVGPVLDTVLAAVARAGRDLTVLYTTTPRPFDAAGLRAAVDALAPKHAAAPTVTVVEPYLAGTSARVVAEALADRPHRQVMLGTRREELRLYGTRAEHDAAHGLDVRQVADAL
ncbi:transketolase family protein [Actinomycetospora sp. TBRC 11914]|uniref:transketolase family protein n=1 Tax=Actinomycetospora sp. TBRC 11914 TaxID=2729387 RepID=UPI00145EBFAB|nr:transketolase [Actinomycetospora sp. TBRC 11914]NMO91186.1 transketolase [Actinomycetospora sp. TBRC 11914]